MPDDASESIRLRNVHPAGWVNPQPKARYHLVVVGGGTAGLVTAAIAAGLGAKTALVERHWMGGDCLNVGCVPSKALIRSGRSWNAATTAQARFGGPAVAGQGDFASVMKRMRGIRADMSAVDSADRFRSLGVDVFFGQASFRSEDRASVGGQDLEFRRAVIATGSRPAVPPIPGLADARYLTNETVFTLTECPRRLVVIGAGAIGSELAQTFARFGSKVTLLEREDRILTMDDPDAARVVALAIERDGVTVLTGVTIDRVVGSAPAVVHFTRNGVAETAYADAILVAGGRAPNVDGLGLDAAGVEYDDRKVMTDNRLRTSNRRIYAAGDITGRAPFTHAADAQARMVIRNALFFGRAKVENLVVPWCTYTQPEVAHVGMSWESMKNGSVPTESLTIPLRDVDRARLDGSEDGFLRVHLRKGSDRIVAATLVADRAGDTIAQLSMAMTRRLGLGAIGETIFPYPTESEAIRKAADAWRRKKLTPRAAGLFRTWFKYVR